MIIFKGVTKTFKRGGFETTIFENMDLELSPDRRIALLGLRGSGKTTMLHMMAGLERASRGKIERYASFSLPVGYPKVFKPTLSCHDNAAFLARCYGAKVTEVVSFVRDICDIGLEFDTPLRALLPEHRIRFIYAIGYALPFDVYLIDNTAAVGSPQFKEKCEAMFLERAKSAGVIFATSVPRVAQRYCEAGLLIVGNTVVYYPDLDEAIWNLASLARDAG